MNTPHPTQHTWQDHSGPVQAEYRGVTVIDCRVCGFKHSVPLPDDARNRHLYTRKFYDDDHPGYIESQQQDLPWRRLDFAARYDLFEKMLPRGRRRLLDVGSGPGWFLQYGAERGWDAVGIEPSPPVSAFSRDTLGLDVITGFFEAEAVAGLEPFDVVHLNNVLEHVPNPAKMLATAHGVLRPSGLICVSVPNDFNPLQEALVKLRGHERWWVDPREHVNYFDRDSLERLLSRRGFVMRRRLGSFPLELLALMGEDYIADPDLGPVVHGRRKALELALHEAGRSDLLAEMYAKLGEMGLGRTLTVVGEKISA